MASSKDYKEYILEQLSEVPNATCRPMMGEFLLYSDGVLFGGIYDDRLLAKVTDTDFDFPKELPYEGAKKPMYFIENIEDKDKLAEIIKATIEGLRKK